MLSAVRYLREDGASDFEVFQACSRLFIYIAVVSAVLKQSEMFKLNMPVGHATGLDESCTY